MESPMHLRIKGFMQGELEGTIKHEQGGRPKDKRTKKDYK